MNKCNFFQVVPGTEHFANIDMMIEYVKQCGTDGLIKVLENTKKFGYDLYQNTTTLNSILFTTNWDEEPRNIQDKETGEERFIECTDNSENVYDVKINNNKKNKMKSNELRIGNLVKDRGGKILQIDWFERDKVCQKMIIAGAEVHPMTEDFEQLQPIELNSDWFYNGGFLKNGAYWNKDIDEKRDINIIKNGDEYSVFFCNWDKDGDMGEVFVRAIKYVHELQNLWFALTGKELTFKSEQDEKATTI